ncbi:BURP domain-containing protein 17 isoform X1 [Jatropha curcas]|uniref:BURP domain-containing protein 17 isoform X1 n=1 Tax=Jatropha curcas TaxID=180498 RepID=UPI001895290D|nr:BURP domain-containing protein 17 isoform X1 [Jatropha curcas]
MVSMAMEFRVLATLALLSVVVIGTGNAALPAEMYWHSKLPNTPIPQDLLSLLQHDMGDTCTFWDMGLADKTSEDRRFRYKYSENPFEDNTEDRRFRYKYSENLSEENTEDRREKYKRYGNPIEENTDDTLFGYKYSENPSEENTDDRREKYKRYGNPFEENTDDKRFRYKYSENPSEENTEDKREKYKRYGNPFEENTDDKRFRYRYSENPSEENTEDKREKYKRYGNLFEENTDDKRFRYRYSENPSEENTEDKREKYKRYGNPFEENTEDGKFKYKYSENPSEENTEDRREKYKRYEEKFHKHNLPNSTVFFVYNDLHAGQKMRVHITKSTNKARILPRQVAESIPFSTDKLSEIFQRFSVDPESRQSKVMKQTIEDCESPGIKGEDRYCSTSLESLIDFSVKHVGNKVQVLFNKVDEPKRVQEYTIMDVKFMGENHVVCHKQKYPYAVYYCHALNGTRVYTAQLVGADGTEAEAVAVCHSDTSDWSPKHMAFLLLNMKPGEGTICHFIRSDTLVMVSADEDIEKTSNDTNLLSHA